MATIQVNFTLKKQSVPADPPASGTLVAQLMQGSVVKDQKIVDLGNLPTQFENVANGDYTVVAQTRSMANTFFGPLRSSPTISVVNMTEVDVVDIITVSL